VLTEEIDLISAVYENHVTANPENRSNPDDLSTERILELRKVKIIG
jgi:hypothetical protein